MSSILLFRQSLHPALLPKGFSSLQTNQIPHICFIGILHALLWGCIFYHSHALQYQEQRVGHRIADELLCVRQIDVSYRRAGSCSRCADPELPNTDGPEVEGFVAAESLLTFRIFGGNNVRLSDWPRRISIDLLFPEHQLHA